MSRNARINIAIGQVFERLTVAEHIGAPKNRFRCRCACGNETVVQASQLHRGRVGSCGCKRVDTIRARGGRKTHGKWRHPLYATWSAMKARCGNPKSISYGNYGARGVRVCDRWLGADGFPNFLVDMGERPEGMSIDRIDGAKGYEPSNCRWATAAEQSRNARQVKLNEVSVCLMRHMRRRGARLNDIAHAFDVAPSTASLAINGRQWR